jgi:hypothetical protein
MQNIFVSSSKTCLYLLIGSDPNQRREEMIRLSGIPRNADSFQLRILGFDLNELFVRSYEQFDASLHSLLEFYTYLPSGNYVAELVVDDFRKKIQLSL